MKSIAVIGAGISGLAAAALLSRRHRVDLFEQERRLGGHTNTVLVDGPNGIVPLDTGFLVHNDRTYPNLVRLFANSAWPPATRTCPSPCRAGEAGSSTAAAAPTGSSPSGGTW